jgi:hypothetical protein
MMTMMDPQHEKRNKSLHFDIPENLLTITRYIQVTKISSESETRVKLFKRDLIHKHIFSDMALTSS